MNGKSLPQKTKENVGNKAQSLEDLKQGGFCVPRFKSLLISDCTEETIEILIKEYFLDVSLFAVRSSAECEDGKEKSFAGHFYTALAVKKENVLNECLQVIESYAGQDGRVIIQEFIPSTNAGVIFSNAGNDKMVINSTIGLCEPVVKGKSCDEYILERKTGALLLEKIELKDCLIFGNETMSEVKSDKPSLNEKELRILYTTAIKIENMYGAPQDIECCFYNGKLYILQSRPITRKIFSEKNTVYYDNANIAESYSGIVLPLTFSFAQQMYKTVYMDLLCASCVSRKKVNKYESEFSSLIAIFYGRMYYNMNSWYTMMSFVPGYDRNKRNLELMISSNIRSSIERPTEPSFLFSFFYYILVFFKILLLPLTVYYFKKVIKKNIRKYQNTPIETFSQDKCEILFKNLCNGPLRKWYITVENDTVLMTLYGRAQAKNSEIFKGARITKKTVSASQVQALKNMSASLMRNVVISESIKIKDKDAFVKSLNENQKIKKEYDAYFALFGGRFASELKLESPDLEEDFSRFASLVELYSADNNNHIYSETPYREKQGILDYFIDIYATNREETRLLRTNMFAIVRRIFKRIGVLLHKDGFLTESSDIFYLTIEEIFSRQSSTYKNTILERKKTYYEYGLLNPASHFALTENMLPPTATESEQGEMSLQGTTSSGGTIRGRVRVFTEFVLPKEIDFDILVARHTDPGWVPLIGLSKGIIVENGGLLSHASIVTRELGIPAAIGVKNATTILKTGDIVEITHDGRVVRF